MTVWGVVPTTGRGSLPFTLVHGEACLTVASWALAGAGAELLDFDRGFSWLREDDLLVVHDPLCPLVPMDFLTEAIERGTERGGVVVGVRPVTDTVKEVSDGVLGRTHDREELQEVASPLVLPGALAARLRESDLDDLAGLVHRLCHEAPVEFLVAPPEAARLRDEDDVPVLEARTRSQD